MPRFDGPYHIVEVHPEASSYTLDIPNRPDIFPSFHVSQLKRYIANDPSLFPSRELPKPGPILIASGLEEYHIEHIIDSRPHMWGIQYLVCWSGYGPEHNTWLPAHELAECEALDQWISGQQGSGSQ